VVITMKGELKMKKYLMRKRLVEEAVASGITEQGVWKVELTRNSRLEILMIYFMKEAKSESYEANILR
jgi:hypothetical protein